MSVSSCFSVSYVKNINGKEIAIVDGYTYYRDARKKLNLTWQCTQAGKCKARFTTTHCGMMVRAFRVHEHLPPQIFVENGIMYRTKRPPLYAPLAWWITIGILLVSLNWFRETITKSELEVKVWIDEKKSRNHAMQAFTVLTLLLVQPYGSENEIYRVVI